MGNPNNTSRDIQGTNPSKTAARVDWHSCCEPGPRGCHGVGPRGVGLAADPAGLRALEGSARRFGGGGGEGRGGGRAMGGPK